MKKIHSIAIATILIATIGLNYGCTGKKTIKKTFHMVLELNFDVQDPSNTSYEQIQLLDASGQNTDFAKGKSDLISLGLDSARYYTTYVVDPTNNQKITSGAVTVSSENGNENITLASIQNVNLMSIFEEAASQKLTLDSGGMTKFADLLTSSPNKAKIKFAGAVNSAPTDFRARIKFYVTFTAWVL
jgi:hypothetical protein